MKNKISWHAPEFIHYPKSNLWFGILIGLSSFLVAFFLFRGDYVSSLLFFLLFLSILIFSRSKPRTLRIEISDKGVNINDAFIPYHQIKSFWIIYNPPHVKMLNLETTAFINRALTLQLHEQDPEHIRGYLLEFLPEDMDRGEDLSEQIARKIKL